ncbi:hypothetical protein U1Q18_036285, partial [Sarracenia purpurea var. burkii]
GSKGKVNRQQQWRTSGNGAPWAMTPAVGPCLGGFDTVFWYHFLLDLRSLDAHSMVFPWWFDSGCKVAKQRYKRDSKLTLSASTVALALGIVWGLFCDFFGKSVVVQWLTWWSDG